MPLAIALEDVEGAAKRIEDEAIHTPVMTCRTLNAMSGRCCQCMNLFVLRKLATQPILLGPVQTCCAHTLVVCSPVDKSAYMHSHTLAHSVSHTCLHGCLLTSMPKEFGQRWHCQGAHMRTHIAHSRTSHHKPTTLSQPRCSALMHTHHHTQPHTPTRLPSHQRTSYTHTPRRELFFKCELFQRTGSFKFRGALNAVRQLDPSVSPSCSRQLAAP